MSNLLRGVRKLEARLTDVSGLLPHSKGWLCHWEGKLDQLFAGEDAGPLRIPLEALDSVPQTGAAEEPTMKALCRRLLMLENRLGLIEAAEDRSVHELVETIRQRRAARLALEGIEYQPPEDTGDLAGLGVADILRRGRDRARARALAEHPSVSERARSMPAMRLAEGKR